MGTETGTHQTFYERNHGHIEPPLYQEISDQELAERSAEAEQQADHARRQLAAMHITNIQHSQAEAMRAIA